MNKAFTREDSDEATPLIPARAPLPEGSLNYVTVRGLMLLHAEQRELEQARSAADRLEDEGERRRQVAGLSVRLAALAERIACAEVVEHPEIAPEEVRFGAKVRVRGEERGERVVEIVGVDEADAARGRFSFRAPLARALMGRRVGDVASVRAPRGDEEVEILAIEYDAPRAER